MEIVNHDENDVARLYEAALKGNVDTLTTLIQKDQLILFRVSLTSLSETPLHISAMLGHLDFVRALLSQKPDLAAQLDSLRHSPLHLASAERHTEIVKALLGVNKEVCLVRDQDGRIPLYLAAMRGRVEVIQELISAQPESVREVLDRRETVLHLCVKYNQLEALKLLVQLVNDEPLINSINQDGNTILHMAVMHKQLETIRFLLSKPEGKAIANTLNGNGFTILDIIEHSPRDFKSYEIRDILMEASVERATHPSPPTITNSEAQSAKSSFTKFLDIFVDQHTLIDWFQNSQGPFMTVATLIATVAFQGAISPPGGVFQDTVSVNNSTCNPNFTKINNFFISTKKETSQNV